MHYVPKLFANQFSLGQLLKKGYKINFDDVEGTIIDKKKISIVAKVPLYLILLSMAQAHVTY